MEGLINGLAFAPGPRSLAVAADQNTVDVWDLTDPTEPVETLVETRHAPTADVAFSRRAGREPKGVPSSSSPDDPRGTPRRRRDASSDDPRGTPRRRVLGRSSGRYPRRRRGVAFCSGSLFSTLGADDLEPAWHEATTFEAAQAALDDPRALAAALRRHPTVVNARNPVSHESLLQFAVRKKTYHCVDVLLRAACSVGLLTDTNGTDAIAAALEHGRKDLLPPLLDLATSALERSPLSAGVLRGVQAAVAERYPDVYLQFLGRCFLVPDPQALPGGSGFAWLKRRRTVVAAGSAFRSPPQTFWAPKLVRGDGREKARGSRKTEVQSLVVPFEYALGRDVADAWQDSILALAARCAAAENDFAVFDCTLLRAVVEFKWTTYAKRIFIVQFAICLLHFALVVGFSVALVRLGPWAPGFSAIFAPLVLCSAALFALEVRDAQFLLGGASVATTAGSFYWKALDLACLGLQLIVDGRAGTSPKC